jgi:hypothetical protein
MRFALPFSARARSLALAGAVLIGAVIAPLSADAHFMGWPNGKWQRPGTWSLHLNYSRGCSGGFFTAAGEAGNNWTSTPTPVYYDVTGNPPACDGTPWKGYVDLYSYNNAADWAWGWAQAYVEHTVCDFWFFGCLSSHTVLDPGWGERYVSGVIMLNTAKITGSNYALLVGDVTHEMGHILGLAHSGAYAGEPWYSQYYSIMDYLTWSYNKPKQHDYNDVNALYP